MRLLKPGPPRQWKPIRRQNWNNRFQHFQIQPIKCPVQNNKISTCLLTGDVYATSVSVKCQPQTHFPKSEYSPKMIRELPKSAKLSPTNNRTAEVAPMVFRLICMYPEDYPICYDLSLFWVPVIRESPAFITRACQSRTVKMRIAN